MASILFKGPTTVVGHLLVFCEICVFLFLFFISLCSCLGRISGAPMRFFFCRFCVASRVRYSVCFGGGFGKLINCGSRARGRVGVELALVFREAKQLREWSSC